jgi:hypothetical protein
VSDERLTPTLVWRTHHCYISDEGVSDKALLNLVGVEVDAP